MVYTYRKNIFLKYICTLNVIHKGKLRNKVKSLVLITMLLTSAFSVFMIVGIIKASGIPPSISNPSPSTSSINQSFNPTLSITVNDPEEDMMNVTFRTNASGVTTRTFFYNNYTFHNWSTSSPQYLPEYLVDNDNNTCAASIGEHRTCFILDNNTCDGTNLGNISKVELIARVGGTTGDSSSWIWIIYSLIPTFKGINGNKHNFTWNYSKRKIWVSCDITNDSNAPTMWMWGNVSNLNCELWDWEHHKEENMCGRGYRVGVRVTYDAWTIIGTNNSVGNSTCTQIPTNMDNEATTYY